MQSSGGPVIALLIAASAALAAQAPEPPGVGTNGISLPRVVRYVEPEYPAIAFTAGVSGTVVADATIGSDGEVLGVRINRSVPLLDAAVRAAVRQWQFDWPTAAGVSPSSTVSLSFDFIFGKRPLSTAPPARNDTSELAEFAFTYQYECPEGHTVLDSAARSFIRGGATPGGARSTPAALTPEELQTVRTHLNRLQEPVAAMKRLPVGSEQTGPQRRAGGLQITIYGDLPLYSSHGPRPFLHTLDIWDSQEWRRVTWFSHRQSALATLGEELRRIVARKPAIRALLRDERACLD